MNELSSILRKLNASVVALSICCIISCANKIDLEAKYPIIPTPQEISYGESEVFFESITITNSDFTNETSILKSFFQQQGIGASENGLKIQFIKEKFSAKANPEAYTLVIDNEITISATTERGAFYGLQSLKQILRIKDKKGVLPKINISDWPAFTIRGFMHDTGRNFQSVEQLKEQLEILSQYKYNVFHWHLTDNPGWRLESKKYPELQLAEVTTRRKGVFYTQQDFKDVLAFCKERHITVIPEFDIPGHTAAFRKAFGLTTMRDKKVLPILLDLFDELCALASPEDMPYIHIGTDEVRKMEESVAHETIFAIINRLKKHNREVVVWKHGIEIKKDTTSISQLWAKSERREGHRFIDSRSNYVNHLDPLAGMARLFFQQPCRQPKGDSLALGGVLCAWPDNNLNTERDILKQNPIYPSMVFYADAIWKGREKDFKEYWAKLPNPNTNEFIEFQKFEEKVIAHRNMFFKNKEFPYVRQTNVFWKVIGPFKHKGNVTRDFPVEDSLKDYYIVDGKKFEWRDSIVGGTIHLKHFFGFPSLTNENTGTFYAYTEIYSPDDRQQDFWIGFHGWSRSGGRRGGPAPKMNQWHTTNPKVWINNLAIAPPVWQQPNLGAKTAEIPFIDEDYFYRAPTKVALKKGWNKVILKIPQGGNSWKWMFTFIPINISKNGVSEVEELKFSTNFNN